MYLMPQGQNPNIRIDELEKRLQALENLVNDLQLELKPKRGRPPKDSYERKSTEGNSSIRD